MALFYPDLYEPLPPFPRVRYFLPRGTSELYRQAYLSEDVETRAQLLQDWRVAPIRADLRALPPCVVVVAEFDPLADSNTRLADAMAEAGVRVECVSVDSVPHGFLTFPFFARDGASCNDTLDKVEFFLRTTESMR